MFQRWIAIYTKSTKKDRTIVREIGLIKKKKVPPVWYLLFYLFAATVSYTPHIHITLKVSEKHSGTVKLGGTVFTQTHTAVQKKITNEFNIWSFYIGKDVPLLQSTSENSNRLHDLLKIGYSFLFSVNFHFPLQKQPLDW